MNQIKEPRSFRKSAVITAINMSMLNGMIMVEFAHSLSGLSREKWLCNKVYITEKTIELS